MEEKKNKTRKANKKNKEQQKTCCVKNNTQNFRKLETVPPMCPLGFQLFFSLKEAPISPKYGTTYF